MFSEKRRNKRKKKSDNFAHKDPDHLTSTIQIYESIRCEMMYKAATMSLTYIARPRINRREYQTIPSLTILDRFKA